MGEFSPGFFELKFFGCNEDGITLAPGIHEGLQQTRIKTVLKEFILDHLVVLVSAPGIELTEEDQCEEIAAGISVQDQPSRTGPADPMIQKNPAEVEEHDDTEDTHQMKQISCLKIPDHFHGHHFSPGVVRTKGDMCSKFHTSTLNVVRRYRYTGLV
jgi:hypothetical protein